MCPRREFCKQDGFSMVELVISLSTMLVITGAALALVGSSLKFASTTYYTTDAEQSLRTAQEIINRDLTSTGDGLRTIGTITVPKAFAQAWLTRTPVDSVVSTNSNLGLVDSDNSVPANTAVPQASPAVNFQTNSDRISTLIKDNSFADVSVGAGKITQSGSNTLITLNTTNNTSLNDINKFQAGEIYAIFGGTNGTATFGVISGTDTTTKVLTFSNSDTYSLNLTGTNSPIYAIAQLGTTSAPVSIIRMQMIQYYVDANNLLHRRVLGVKGAGFVDSVIAEHVTSLKFRYFTNLLDTSGNVKPPVSVITSAEQPSVRQIETTVVVETVRAVNPTTNSNTGRKTISSTTSTSVRNLQFFRNDLY